MKSQAGNPVSELDVVVLYKPVTVPYLYRCFRR